MGRTKNMTTGPLYRAMADELGQAMQDGRLSAGDRLASVREASRQRGVSLNTVIAAYQHLETRGLIEARPQSGYYVKPQLASPCKPMLRKVSKARPTDLAVIDHIAAVVEAQGLSDHVDLSLACPRVGSFYPADKLARILSSLARRRPGLITNYSLPPGSQLLRTQIVRHAKALGMELEADQLLLTNGCMEALMLSLRAVTRPNDAVGLESPTYFNLLPLIHGLGLRAVEIPTHPTTGMSIDALEALLSEERLATVITMPTVHNPLGATMPLESKRRLAELVNQYQVPLIEDAIYAELQFALPLTPTVRSFDRGGWVMVCGSFTKTLAPGFRVGWVEGGRFAKRLAALKFTSSVAQPCLLEEGVGQFLETGGYVQHLRRLRRSYASQLDQLRGIISESFPPGTLATKPSGGFVLWVELPTGCDANELFRQALQERIVITPGTLYSPSGRYGRHLRLSGCYPLRARAVTALRTLGRLATRQWQSEGG